MQGCIAMGMILALAKASICMLQFVALGGIERAESALAWGFLGFVSLEVAGHVG